MKNKKDSGFYFMILGLVIGIFSISFFFSYSKAESQNLLEKFNKKDLVTYKILSNNKLNDMVGLLEDEEGNTAIVLENSIFINDSHYNIVATNSKGFQLYGIDHKANTVTIGKGIKNLVYSKGEKDYIKLDNTEYEVGGYIKDNALAYSILMNTSQFVKDYSNLSLLMIEFNFIDKNLNKDNIINKIKSLGLKGISKGEIEIDEIKVGEANIEKGKGYIAVIIVIVSFINVCSFSLMWINGRAREISLYKALGAKNRSILLILFIEVLQVSIIAMILALVLQYLANSYINTHNLMNRYLWIDFSNLLSCGAMVAIMSLLSVIPAFLVTTHIEPALSLKEE